MGKKEFLCGADQKLVDFLEQFLSPAGCQPLAEVGSPTEAVEHNIGILDSGNRRKNLRPQEPFGLS